MLNIFRTTHLNGPMVGILHTPIGGPSTERTGTISDVLPWVTALMLGGMKQTAPPHWRSSAKLLTVGKPVKIMMTSSRANISRVTGPLCGKSTGDRWILLTKAINTAPWCFLWYAPKQTVEQIIWTPVIWDAMAILMSTNEWKCGKYVMTMKSLEPFKLGEIRKQI